MPKRKLSNDYANILNFVNGDDDQELDSDDEFDSDDLNELYDKPDLDADDDSSGDCSDSSDEGDTQPDIFTYKQLVNSLNKSLDPAFYDSHDFGTADSRADEKVSLGYFGRKMNPKT